MARSCIIAIVLLSVFALTFGQGTIWEELPASVAFDYKMTYFTTPVNQLIISQNQNHSGIFSSQSQPWVMMGFGPNATYTWIEANVTASCDDPTSNGRSVWMNSQQDFFCVKESTLTVNEISPDNYFSILNSYNFSNDFQDFSWSNDKVLLSTGVDTRGVGFQVFDTLTSTFECQVDASDSDETFYSSYTYIDDFFILATNQDTDIVGYVAINCTDNTNVTFNYTFDFNQAATSWIVLNQSSVLVSVVKDVNDISFLPLTYDNGTWSNGTILTLDFNPNLITTLLTQQVNDTCFLSAYQDGTGANWLGLFYVDENLNVVESSSINLGQYAADVASIVQGQGGDGAIINFNGVPPQGSSQTPVPIAFVFVNLTTFTVDQGGPIHGWANYPGFRFGNNTFADFSLLGVWVYSFGGSRTFYPYPIWDYYISPDNDDIIWGMYTDDYYHLAGVDGCYLVQIQKSTQNVSKIVLNTTCDCGGKGTDDGYWFTLGDVFVDSNGNYNAAYRCNSNHYGVVVAGNNSYVIEDEDLTLSAQDPLLYPSYQKGVLNVVDFSVVGDINLKSFNITSGALVTTTNLAHSTSSNQTGAKISSDLLVITNKPTQVKGITPVSLYSVGQKSSLFQFMIPSSDLDGIVPLAFDPNTFPYSFLYVTSFASQPLFVYTPQSEATLTENLILGSLPIEYVDNTTFTYTTTDQWIGEYFIYNATPNFVSVPISAGILGVSMLLLLAILGLLL